LGEDLLGAGTSDHDKGVFDFVIDKHGFTLAESVRS
jgi:hypothetical protein